MKLPIAGASYQLPQIDINNQRCLNMYPIQVGSGGRGSLPENAKAKAALIPTQGNSLFINLGESPIRYLGYLNNIYYAVSGTSVYTLTINNLTRSVSSTLIGTITSTTGNVYAAANPTQVIFVDGSTTGYLYIPSTGSFATVNSYDSDFTGGTQVEFLDGYFIVNEPNTGRVYTSALNDGKVWDPADVFSAESGTDNVVGLAVSKGELWVIGVGTSEVWYDAANATGSPFSAREGLAIQNGCIAPGSIAKMDDLLIWLDSRGFVVQTGQSPYVRNYNTRYQLDIISDDALNAEFAAYTRIDNAKGYTFIESGRLMYSISFPTMLKTWVYDYTTKVWHERSYYNSYTNQHEHHLIQYYAPYVNLCIGGGDRNGKVYLMSPETYSDNTAAIHRVRTVPVFYDSDNFKLISIDKLEIRVMSGYALQSGQGSSPQIMMRFSTDGGHTWSNEETRSIGVSGEYGVPVTWWRIGYGREFIFEFTFTDPINFALLDGIISYEEVED